MLAVHFPGFRVTGIDCADDRIRIDISVNSNAAKCPDCGSMSTSVHSSYPLAGATPCPAQPEGHSRAEIVGIAAQQHVGGGPCLLARDSYQF